jgi:hypothetical protein
VPKRLSVFVLQIIMTGTCDKLEGLKRNPLFGQRRDLCRVWGIGPKTGKLRRKVGMSSSTNPPMDALFRRNLTADDLIFKHGVRSFQELRAAVLNSTDCDKQLWGAGDLGLRKAVKHTLKHFDDLQVRSDGDSPTRITPPQLLHHRSDGMLRGTRGTGLLMR